MSSVKSDPEMELDLLFEAYPFTDAPFKILQTYDEKVDMSRSPANNDPPDNVRPNPANVREWVDQQSLPFPTPTVVISKPPDIESEGSSTPTQRHSGLLQPKAYKIETLLALGRATPMENMALRIHPGALTENIFKDRTQKAYPKPQEKTRYRVSNHSTLTHRTNRSEEEVIFSGREYPNAHKPYREPQNPPKEEFAQQQEGFKRFLKQVASPPHNRVTAGGRIVPAGPYFPPPMLNYDSIEKTINQPMPKTLLNVNASNKSNAREGGTEAQTSSNMFPGQYKVNQNTNPVGLYPLGAVQVQDSGNIHHGGFDGSIFLFPPGIEPVYWLAGGGAIVSIQGQHYQASWNGPQMTLEHPYFTMTPEHTAMMNAQVVHGSHQAAAVKPVIATERQTSLTNTTSRYASCQLQPSNQTGRKISDEEYENLRAQLKELDKHLALYHHKLSAFEHSALVAQRKHLVETIDFHRKKRNERTASFSAPVVGQHAAIGMQPQHSMGNSINKNHGAAQATLVNKKSLAPSTCLSPDAPPFVPSNAKAGSKNLSLGNPWAAPGPVPAQYKHTFENLGFPENGRVPNFGPGVEASSAAQATRLTSQTEGQGVNGTTSRLGEAASEPERLPEVLQEDIEYAVRLGVNPASEEKKYCTTGPEFQEVIRRVREQARLYGCKGGQSKDPAFDAEQDIRWAMADHEPIALPRSTPDHVAKPRPWSWDDSAYKVLDRNSPAGTSINGHSSSTYVPSNSQEKSSGADILDDPFRTVTRRGADSWHSDGGVNGAIDSTNDGKRAQYGTPNGNGSTATELAEITGKGKGKSIEIENGAPSTPKQDRTRAFTKRVLSSGSALHTPPKSTKDRRPYQTYVEDSFTPSSGPVQVASKPFPERHSESNSHFTDRNFLAADPWDRPVNSVWDRGTGKLISADGLPTVDAHNAVFPGWTREAGPEGNTNYDSWAPITKSKSGWGPEEDAESLDARGLPKSYGASAPKVNIPFALPKPSSQPVGYVPPELTKGYRPPKMNCNDFLRGILKDTHYAYPPSSHSVPSAAEMRLRAKHRAELEKHAANKENLKAEAQCKMERAMAHGPSPSTPSMANQDPRKHKSRSSLASSTFQAQGRVGRLGPNGEDFKSSSQSGGGYVPQHPGMGHYAPRPVTPLHDGPPDFSFTTEVRQDSDGPSYSPRSGMPQ